MNVFREQQQFPTRNYPYRTSRLGPAAAPVTIPPGLPQPNTLYRRILGIDLQPRPMTVDELEGLNDPFGRLLRSGKPFPLTLRQFVEAMDALAGTPDALPN